jgi:hypothetical protein
MPGVILNKTARDMNSTFTEDIEFSEFCTNRGIENKLTIADALPLLSDPNVNLRLIDTVNYVVENKDSPDTIDSFLGTPDSAVAIIRYITEYFYNDLILGGLSNQQFTWAWMAYDNFNEVFSRFKEFFVNAYLSRAFEKGFATVGTTCADYFSGDVLGQYADAACSNPNFNITNGKESYYPYIQAYFFEGRQQFKGQLQMAPSDVDYLFGSDDSLFAKQMKTVLGDLSKAYGCETEFCTDKELAYRQWGDNSILGKLPSQYFDTEDAKLIDWDTKGIFKGVPTEYNLQTGKKLNYTQTKSMLSTDGEGILGLLSLLRRLRNNDKDTIGYLNRVLLGQAYSNLIVRSTASQYLLGYEDSLVKRQNTKPSINAGTPWEPSAVSLIQLNNTNEIKLYEDFEQSKINTGIFDESKLRNWKAVNGKYTTGYKTIIDQDKDGNLLTTWIDTGRSINGTNLLGFRPQLDEK